jgi:hypothetical protein
VLERLHADLDFAAGAPMLRTVLIAGEWSFVVDGEQDFAVKAAVDGFAQPSVTRGRQHAAAWTRSLRHCTDLQSGQLTH